MVCIFQALLSSAHCQRPHPSSMADPSTPWSATSTLLVTKVSSSLNLQPPVQSQPSSLHRPGSQLKEAGRLFVFLPPHPPEGGHLFPLHPESGSSSLMGRTGGLLASGGTFPVGHRGRGPGGCTWVPCRGLSHSLPARHLTQRAEF